MEESRGELMSFCRHVEQRRDGGACTAPACGRELRQEELRRRMAAEDSGRLLESLHALSPSFLRSLCAKRHISVVKDIVRAAREVRGGRIILDSDGTNYLTLRGDDDVISRYRSDLLRLNRVLPGGAIQGEVAQEFTRQYVAHPAAVEVWRVLAQHGVYVSILSGRSASDLRQTYDVALDSVPGFDVRAAKGRIVCEGTTIRASSSLESRLAGDPLGVAFKAMTKDLSAMVGHSYEQLAPAQFEERFGYRITTQEVQGVTVLIRLHHRFRACMLAREAGASLTGLREPHRANMAELSAWLLSRGSEANSVLERLQHEDAKITRALTPLRVDGSLDVRDCVGHRSGCQDFSVKLPWEQIVAEVADSGRILLYAGDNFGDSGNDRPVMEAVRGMKSGGSIIGVTHGHGSPSEAPPWMITATQFELFLIQYLAARLLQGATARASE